MGDISQQLYFLKDENERLRQMAMNYEEIERMKQENKEMRLELQKLKAYSEFNGSHYTGITGGNTHNKRYDHDDHSPLSYKNQLTDDIEDNAARTPVT